MSHDIQWGIRQPQPENPDNIEQLTKSCKKCHRRFTVPRLKGPAHRRYCDECVGNRHIPKTRVLVCPRCSTEFTKTGKGRRKYCDRCSRLMTNRPGDGHVTGFSTKGSQSIFDADFDNAAEHSSMDEIDEFYRFTDHVGITTESDLSYVLSEIERYGIVWGRSATNGPQDRTMFIRTGVKRTKATLLDAIDHAYPAPVRIEGLDLDRAIKRIREWNGSPGWQQRQQIIAEKAEAINQRILKARAERLRAELSKIESALG